MTCDYESAASIPWALHWSGWEIGIPHGLHRIFGRDPRFSTRCPTRDVSDYRGIIKYLAVPNSLVSCSVTAEVASSSLVVPAILSKALRRISLKPLGARKGRVSRPFCALFRRSRASYPATRVAPSSSEEKTSDITAACAACFAGVTACGKRPTLSGTTNAAAAPASP